MAIIRQSVNNPELGRNFHDIGQVILIRWKKNQQYRVQTGDTTTIRKDDSQCKEMHKVKPERLYLALFAIWNQRTKLIQR